MQERPLHGVAPVAPRWWAGCLIGLLAVTVAWRGAALMRLAEGPLLGFLNADSAIYWEWAGEIRHSLVLCALARIPELRLFG